MWPTSEAQQNGGVLIATMLDALNGFVNAVLTTAPGATYGGWEMGVYSQKLAQFTPITTGIVSNLVATQRRRRSGTGS